MSYCSQIWVSNLTAKEIKVLTVLQKKAIRLVHSKKYNAHTSKLFEINGITKFENIVKREGILMTYKYINKELPKAIMNLFENNIEISKKTTRETDRLHLKPKSNLKKGNIMFEILNSWNSIENSIRLQKNIPSIKKGLQKIWNKGENCTKNHCYNCKNK